MAFLQDFSGYKWIKVKRYKMDESLSWEERYKQLEAHHVEETTFLIEKIREVAEEARADIARAEADLEELQDELDELEDERNQS